MHICLWECATHDVVFHINPYIHSIMYRQSCKPFLATYQSGSIQSKQDSIHSIKMMPNSVFSNTTTYSFQQGLQQQQLYGVSNPISLESSSSGWQVPNDHHSASLLYNLSILKDKFHQVQSLVDMFVIDSRAPESTSAALASMTTFVQEIIVSASSMLFTCQQMAIGNNNNNCTTQLAQEGLYEAATAGNGGLDRYGNESYSTNNTNCEAKDQYMQQLPQNCDIVELNAADLLAKYTHYCQVCGKGFKRDANLRMHMRAHGDEYKSAAALTSPFKMKANTINNEMSNTLECSMPRKYSCPQEGCRWNKKHAKFQPLKSMICAKNHYKRSHCPKMYVCKRCSRKQFSVLSDLRTHEKHCGDLKWQCSCGTTFSRKDKLMGHVGLFVGHKPLISNVGADRNKVKRAASSSYTNN